MLSRSLSKTYNLLTSMNNFPARMIIGFAKTAPEEVRAMYIELFDESKDVYERINSFKMKSSILLENMGMELHSIINTKMRLVYTCGYAIRTSTMFINLVKSNRYLMNLRVITDSKRSLRRQHSKLLQVL